MVLTASNSVQKYRLRIQRASWIPSRSSTGSPSRTEARGLRDGVFSPVPTARMIPSEVRFPLPKGTVTRTPGTA